MIRVVVAEDKPLILRNIKERIQNSRQDVKIVGEATNGQSALSLIADLKPDIVFTDIKMPLMDGLALITKVREMNHPIHFVIISGYDEFEYARQAMKLNVSDYLLKPVKQEEVNEIMNKIAVEINLRSAENNRALLQNILNSNVSTQASMKAIPGCDYFLSVLLNAGPYSNFIIDYANPFNSYWSSNSPEKVISSGIGSGNSFWIFDGKSFNELILVLGISNASDFSPDSFLQSLKICFDAFAIPVTIAVSQKLDSINSIGLETQILRALLRKNLIYGSPAVLYKGESPIISGSNHPVIDSSLEKRIMTYIKNNQKNLFLKEMGKLFNFWEENNYTQNHIEKLLKHILKLCQKASIEQSSYTSDLELETDEILSSSRDYKVLFQGMSFIFDQFFALPDRTTGGDFNRDVMNKVESYLNTSYADPVTIHDIAKMVNLHPAYLSRSFKNSKGVSPMEYLTNLRIQKAKELIVSHVNLSLKEIAEIVGYSDQFYFSKIFKTITGKSPSEFKTISAGS